jgi:predicted transcriptional regulator
MREVLSIRIDAETKKRLESLAERLHQSRSAVAADAITAYVSPGHAKRARPHGRPGKAAR